MSTRRLPAAAVAVAMTGVVIVVMDWVPTPLNRNIAYIDAGQRLPGTIIHGAACALAVVALTRGPRWARYLVPVWFGLVLSSALLNWWVPYVTGSYPGEIDARTFQQEYATNLSVLPAWAGHPVIPDVQHMLIHTLLAASLVLSVHQVTARSNRRRKPQTNTQRPRAGETARTDPPPPA